HDPVERRVRLLLQLRILDDRLDHDIAIGEIFEIRRPLEAAHAGIHVGLLHLSLLDELAEGFLDAGDSLVEKLLFDLAHDRLVSGLRGDLSDSRAHEAAAENAHFPDCHWRDFLSEKSGGFYMRDEGMRDDG